MQKSGVWIAVLLIHVFLWMALDEGRDIPKSRQNPFTYLSVVQIVLNDPSISAPQLVKDSLSDASKISTLSKIISIKKDVIRGVEIHGKKIATSEMYIKKKRAKELVNGDEISVLQKLPSHPVNEDSSKKTKMLDYNAMKQIALSIAHDSENRSLSGADKKLSGSQKFAETIERGKRGDCRTEYAHLLLIAIPFLLKDTITGGGCR
ncbi:MAG: hypothetical protein JWQ10_3441 [Herbaspirillum sp.]|nr:hypothetical protein [Herbaspirillum sp.]